MTDKRVAIVTGASRGIGEAIARRLATDGCHVIAVARRAEKLEAVVGSISAAGGSAEAISCDMADPAAVQAMVEQVAERHGRIDVLVNNAGITIRRAAVEVTPEDWEAIHGINLKGAYFLSQHMGRHLVAVRRPGCIVNIASTHGLVGYPQRSVYGIAKAGLIHMTRTLAVEWAQYGIRVNAIAPGTVNTPSRESHFATDPQAREAIVSRVPLRRFATMEEVGAAVCYLVRPESAYVTGHTLLLDGGLTAQ